MGRYVSSKKKKTIWHIYSFPIHLAVHLEKGQRVYFTTQKVLQRAIQPPSTTLTSFFNVSEWWIRPNTAILKNAQILYLESILKNISTSETRKPNPRLSQCSFHRCNWRNLFCLSKQRWVLLFENAISQCLRSNIIPTSKNC